jgi:hypothetical protein
MSYFGKWECPVCGSTWSGSIGWIMPETDEKCKELLHNICGCDGRKDEPKPVGSFSICNFQSSEIRKQKYDK